MKINWKKINRKTHYWGAIICALPIIVVLVSGVLLQLKKHSDWIQPPTLRGAMLVPDMAAGMTAGIAPAMEFAAILAAAQTIPELDVVSWRDIDRLDVRPAKGIIKLRARNHWEAQFDHGSGELLQLAYRRTDFIESLHDGSFFHPLAKMGVFLPAAIILTLLWFTGIYLFVISHLSRRRSKLRRENSARDITNNIKKKQQQKQKQIENETGPVVAV